MQLYLQEIEEKTEAVMFRVSVPGTMSAPPNSFVSLAGIFDIYN